MAAPKMKVTVELPLASGRRLRAMCKAKGMTAAQLLDRWIDQHDDAGNPQITVRVVDERVMDQARAPTSGRKAN